MKHTRKEPKQDIAFEAMISGEKYHFLTTWGLFSPTEVDEGSRLLLEYIEVNKDDTILDIGCGWGALGVPLARMASKGSVHMVDKDFVAVEYAKKNAQANDVPNVDVYLSNGFSHVAADAKFDLVVSNLPAKVGRELLRILLEDAKDHLKSGGAIYVVTISGLREFIKKNFQEVFGNYEKVKQGAHYTVAKAIKE